MKDWEVEQIKTMFIRDAYRCRTCGKSVYLYGHPQRAHRIANTRANRRKYGDYVIDHIDNWRSVCRTEPCNSKQNIGNNPILAQKLADDILGSITVHPCGHW